MSDDADMAVSIEAELIAHGLAGISAAIPAGVPGECDDCGEMMPRLVAGRCAFCRDGRRPPASVYERAAARPAPIPITAKEANVANYKDGKYVSVPCEQAVLNVIEHIAATANVSLGIAALELVEAGIRARETPFVHPAAPTDRPATCEGTQASAIVFFENVPDAWLLDEVTRRMNAGVGTDDFDAAIARAEEAEGKLAQIAATLGSARA